MSRHICNMHPMFTLGWRLHNGVRRNSALTSVGILGQGEGALSTIYSGWGLGLVTVGKECRALLVHRLPKRQLADLLAGSEKNLIAD